MALSTGALLGPYQILGALGSGGMGEVYRARDTRLGRTVAIKILPAADVDLKARFAREARAIAALTHPHICTLYDVGHQDGTDYLVMEDLDGETLAARLRRGPSAAGDVLKHAIEIAAALAAAHRAGIVHRDLKPANIMLTSSGAKLLDFGVAKLRPAGKAGLAGMAATVSGSTPLTADGLIIGTPQYMAPEQLEGRDADSRSDLFAFGAIVYEMATGHRAFAGGTAASVIGAIMSAEPRLDELRTRTSGALEHLVKTCLLKNPEERRQTAHDVLLELEWIAEQRSGAPEPRRGGRRHWIWIVPVAALVLVAVALTPGVIGRNSPSTSMRVTLLPPGPEPPNSFPAISPDGTRVAFTAYRPSNETVLWIRPLESEAAVSIPGTDGAFLPFWSPNGRSVGFFAGGKLKTVPADLQTAAPPVQTLADAPDARGGTWSQDGRIVFARNIEDGLYAVPASGGEVTAVTTLNRTAKENSHRWPQFLPDGRRLLYLARSADPNNQGIYVGTPGASDWQLVLRTAVNAMVAASLRQTQGLRLRRGTEHHLLFLREETLMAQPFDLERLQLQSEPFPIAQSIGIAINRGQFSVSNNALLVYRGMSAPPRRLVYFDRQGHRLPGGTDRFATFPRISRDGKQVAFVSVDPGPATGDIWIEDVGRRIANRLTSHQAFEWIPIWAPQGDRVAFGSNRNGVMDLYEKMVGAAEQEHLLLESKERKIPTHWSNDGSVLLYQQETAGYGWDLWALLRDSRRAFPLLQSRFNETQGALSPDGKWLAYTSDETGEPQVYLRPYPGPSTGVEKQVSDTSRRLSSDGGDQPRWRADGKELFYLGADGKVMALFDKNGPPFVDAAAAPLFAIAARRSADQQFDVSGDGLRFVAALPSEESVSPLTLLINWSGVAPKK
jgi:serine/threonine protein kinase